MWRRRTIIFSTMVSLLSGSVCAANWKSAGGPLDDTGATLAVSCFSAAGDTLLAGTSAGIFLSIDNGATWSSLDNKFSDAVSSIVVHDRIVYAGNEVGFYHTPLSTPAVVPVKHVPFEWPQMEIAAGPSLIIAGGSMIYRSTDDGAHWKTASGDLPQMRCMGLAEQNGALFIAADNAIYRSADNGITWSKSWSSPGNDHFKDVIVSSIVAQEDRIYAVITPDDEASISAIIVSTDDGSSWNESWTASDERGCGNRAIQLLAVDGAVIVAGLSSTACGDEATVLVSEDNGGSWTTMSAGLPSGIMTNALFVHGTTIWAACGDSGIFRLDLSKQNAPATGVHSSELAPSDKSFAGSLRSGRSAAIDYTLKSAGNLRLNIFTLSGRQVASLVNGFVTAGRHSVSMNSTALPAGTLLLRFETMSCREDRAFVNIR